MTDDELRLPAKHWSLAAQLDRAGYGVPPSGGSRVIQLREIRDGLEPTPPPPPRSRPRLVKGKPQ